MAGGSGCEKKKGNIILGSSSVYRRRVMDDMSRELGLEYSTMSADIDERAIKAGFLVREYADPSILSTTIALEKAAALMPLIETDSYLITCDQVVQYNNEVIREKPLTKEECFEFLRSYCEGLPAVTYSSVVVTCTRTRKQYVGTDVAKQYFLPIPKEEMQRIIDDGKIMSCCGGFIITEDYIKPYLGKREGTEDSLVGYPIPLVRSLLDKAISSSGSGFPP
eukprot:Nk52_evm1s2264 gene=Nk52_evmTU1s2264